MCVDARIILKWIFREGGWELDCSRSGESSGTLCEHSNDPEIQ